MSCVPLRKELGHLASTVLGGVYNTTFSCSYVCLGLIQFCFELVLYGQRIFVQVIQQSAQSIPFSFGELFYACFYFLKR